MPALDSAVRQVDDSVVVTLLLFGSIPVVASLDLFLSSVGAEPPWFAGLVVTAPVALALLLARPPHLRLVACVWSAGLVVAAIWIPLSVFLEPQGDPVGILVSQAATLGVGVALTYPPLRRTAEARLRVEWGAFGPDRTGSKSWRTIPVRLDRFAVVSKYRTVIGLRDDDSDVNKSVRLAFIFGVAFIVAPPLDFIFAPNPTGIISLFLTAGLAAVFGLPVYFGLSRANGSES